MFHLLNDEKYWKIVESLNWPEEKAETKARLRTALGNDRERTSFVQWYDYKSLQLVKACDKIEHQIKRGRLKLLATSILAQGKAAFEAALANPQVILDLDSSGDVDLEFTTHVPDKHEYAPKKIRQERMQQTLQGQIEALKLQVAEAEQNLFDLRQQLAAKIDEFTQEP